MARKTKEERLNCLHEEAFIEFDQVQAAVHNERLQCLKDRRFYSIAGAQWEGPLGEQFANKPRFEVNKIHLSVIRIFNEYRNNRITVDFKTRGKSLDDNLADMCDGLYRANEQDSCADEAYDNAFEEAVGGGIGAWRLRNEYVDESDEDDDEQQILIEPIYDADSSVFFDLQAKKQDKSDARRCWVLTSMTPEAYKSEWGDDPATWPKEIHQSEFDWATPDVVFVAEFYEVEQVRKNIYVWKFITGEEIRLTQDEHEERQDTLLAMGAKLENTKRVTTRKVHKYIMSGSKILEDCGYIAGQCIPIVPVYGKRWFIDNVERCMGHVRLATDVQRLKNMQLSKLGEISALSSVEKPIMTPEQIAGHQVMWSEDNVKDYPYLLINPITDQNGNEQAAGPIAYTKSPMIPPALAALLQITESDIQDLLGNQNQGEQMVNNVAERTVELIQNKLDMQTFIYMDNMKKAMKRSGEIWLSMAKDVFVEKDREMETMGLMGEMETVFLNQRNVNHEGQEYIKNDLAKAKMKVVADVGPASSTKRQATVRNLLRMAMASDDPETKQVLISMAMMNMEGEGIGDVRQYFRQKLIKMGVVEPTEAEQQKLMEETQNRKPTAEEQYLQALAAKEQSEAVKNQVEIIGEQADADKTRAETLEIMNDIDAKQGRLAIEAIEKLGPRVRPPNLPGSPIQP